MDDALKPGSVIDGRFTLVRPLGTGNSSVVWLATDARGPEVALKILHPRFRENNHALSRLEREGELLSLLDHPNIARPVALGINGAHPYLAMELVPGVPLNALLQSRAQTPLSLAEAAQIFIELATAVAHAHEAGVIHRDLKPQNVMVASRGGLHHLKVLDFGVAKLLESSGDGTTQGRTIGSMFYMSPEQTRGDPADQACDTFALGSLLFELLTHRRAWAWDKAGTPLPAFTVPVTADGANPVPEVFDRINHAPRPRPSAFNPRLPPALDLIVATATAIEPSARYPSVRALLAAVGEALPAQPLEEEPEPTRATMVAPQALEAAEEEASTWRGARPAPTREIEGGVSAFLATRTLARAPEPVAPATRILPAPDTALSIERLGSRGGNLALGLGFAVVIGVIVFGLKLLSEAPAPEAPVLAPASIAEPAPRVLRTTTVAAPVPISAPPAPITAPPARSAAPRELEPTKAERPRHPEPRPKAPTKLSLLLARAKAAPEDTERLSELAEEIARAAGEVPDPEARTAIRRLAASSETLGNLAGLEEATRLLGRALAGRGAAP